MSEVLCEDWWEQREFGRQPMEQLRLRFDGDKIVGAGVDVVGRFTMRGTLVHGQIAIVKRYIGQHDVAYVGTYDG